MRTLTTARLTLRTFTQRDLDAVLQWDETMGASSAQEFIDYCFREYDERNLGPWAMQRQDDNVIIGNCGFPHLDRKQHAGEVNYYVAASHRRQGYATEALLAIIEFGFSDLALEKVHGRCQPDNVASERVLQKAGMKFERLVKSTPTASEPVTEEKLYRISRKDFNPRQTT